MLPVMRSAVITVLVVFALLSGLTTVGWHILAQSDAIIETVPFR